MVKAIAPDGKVELVCEKRSPERIGTEPASI
jgi:hypothetical protein